MGDIKPSESHSEHSETRFFNLQPLSPGLCFNYMQGKIQGGSGREANISECLTVVFEVVQDVEIGACAFISSKSDSVQIALLIMETYL